MKRHALFSVFLLSFTNFLVAENWPSWRGDLASSGETKETGLPLEWGREKNVKWRIDLPEPGNSTPVVWENKVFVTQPVTEDSTRNTLCIDRADGSILWQRGVVYKEEERTHRSNMYCSASPAVDDRGLVVSYGSAGLVSYDLEGNELWSRDLGAIDHTWGNSSSPVLYGDLVIHYHGPAVDGVLYGLDRKTGETVWEWHEPLWKPVGRTDGFQDREGEGVIGSFSTPILVNAGGRDELIMSFPLQLMGFDPLTGKQLWFSEGLNPLVYTSPVYDDGIVVAMGGYFGNSIGVKPGGNGDVTDSHRLWQEVRHNGGIGSGVAHDGKLYYQNSGGIAYCDDMKTGKTLWKARLPGAGKSWGSFVLSGNHVYTLSQAGDSVVFAASPEGLNVLAQSDLEEETNSSIAVSDGELFIRTHEGLWCIAKVTD
ncbi:MAG: serine/threonine protein kinase [Verrucomicrobiales bacterium]|nr:serine/threonine protein kinase [Verrucomicrobiales bacterium]